MGILDFLFVSECKLCKTPTQKGSVCAECDAKLRSLINVSERMITVADREIKAKYIFKYEDEIVKKLLFALKRNADKELFVYVSLLYELVIDDGFCGIVTNVPRRLASKRQYGYDHVKEPCRLLCKRNADRLMYSSLLSRRGFSKDQKYLSKSDREKNIKGNSGQKERISDAISFL